MHKIGVVGAGGRLGTEIVKTLASQLVAVVAIASSRKNSWGDLVSYHEYPSNSTPQHLQQLFQELDAVINAAPVSSSILQREAIAAGCHVIDVGIKTKVIEELLQLDELAKTQQRCLVTMAGLAPGLIGLLGTELLFRTPQAEFVDVCLIQNSQGTSGERGTKDMLDLLTIDGKKLSSCLVAQEEESLDTAEVKAFSFNTPESLFLGDRDRMRFYTAFNRPILNTLIVNLGRIRQYTPNVYKLLRNKIAATKATQSIPDGEAILLSAVARKSDGQVASWDYYRLVSDYGATAAIACTTADLILKEQCNSGAGCLGDFVNLKTICQHPWMQNMILENYSN
ncbi:MAG: hypothetical protein ACFCAD_08720 [Pleurocapsa sp.]